ncbi:MAG: DUF885 domain-containing protein [Fulvivirga sp.]|uniref:DUF885 domain-containing protein n=1 Tax=Fulvivirga sp. TaxID=1931237 RepID=UPI0032ECC36C
MKHLIILTTISLLIGCSQKEATDSTQPNINEIADKYIEVMFKFNPELGTFYGVDVDHSLLSDNTIEGIKKQEAVEDSMFSILNAVDEATLSKNDLITYKLLKGSIESSINNRICKNYLWDINQMNGFYTWFRYIANTQPVGDSSSRKDAISRWNKIPQFIKNNLENNRQGLETGYALPKVVIERVIEGLDQLSNLPLEQNPFYLPALKDTTSEFQSKMKAIVEEDIMPVVISYKEFLEKDYLPNARQNLSITNIPNGVACYETSLSGYTTLKENPETIFQWGEEAISIREKAIIDIGNEVYGKTDISDIKQAFKADSSNYFNSREEILATAEAAVKRAKLKVPEYFGLIPQADVIIEPIPEIEEKSAYSRYLPASDDGSTPATYIQQTYKPKTRTKGNIISTAFHETYPGHHLQIAISRELVNSHPVTKYIGNSGFSEGWARYTETLADEMGLYESKKQKLAMLMGLPTGMVVDPGIHFKNWTREEAIEYALSKQTSMTRDDAERYVDRIAVLPGQMTTYGVGEMFFLKLRKSAEKKFGDQFDVKEFHDRCLKNGTVQLDFVTEEINNWVNNK